MKVTLFLALLGVSLLCLLPDAASAQSELIPYIPPPERVGLEYFQQNNISYMNVTIVFPGTGYQVSNWSTPQIVGTNVTVDVTIYGSDGVGVPVETPISHVYDLGELSESQYVFTFKAWGETVKTTSFQIPEFQFVVLLLFIFLAPILFFITRAKKSKKSRTSFQISH